MVAWANAVAARDRTRCDASRLLERGGRRIANRAVSGEFSLRRGHILTSHEDASCGCQLSRADHGRSARYSRSASKRDPEGAVVPSLNEYRRRLGRKQLVVCEVVDDAEAALECWTYDPARLAKGGPVDRLSLYLSLQDSHDERVQKELKAMLEGMKW